MISTKLASISLAAALFSVLPAVQAKAQAIRTFVSVAGSDSNPCTITQPCRHFQAAVNATASGGEVDALDAGAYGSFTISQAISIEGQGWSYVAPPNNGNAITINAVSGKVFIHGVSLNGVGATGSTTGILFNSGGSLNIRDSVIRNFTASGVKFAPDTSSQILVSNTLISDNDGYGIYLLSGASAGATITAALNEVTVGNNNTGVIATVGNAVIELLISNSHIDNNALVGIALAGQTLINCTAILKYVTLNQEPTGVQVGAHSTVFLSQVTQAAAGGFTNTAGVSLTGNAVAYTDGTNRILSGIVGGSLTSLPAQ